MSHDLTPCPRRAAAGEAGKPCQRTFGEQRCTFCGRELPLTNLAASHLASDTRGQAVLQSRLAAARRIKLATLALADRDAGIDTSKRRPRIAGLPALRAQFESRDALPMRVIADLLDEAEPMLELLARVHSIVEKVEHVDFTEAGEHEHACQLIEAIRTTLGATELYPRPWAMARDIPDAAPTCDECGSTLAEVVGRGMGGGEVRGVICLRCASTEGTGTAHLDDEDT